jgi:RHS repeat-associated protein
MKVKTYSWPVRAMSFCLVGLNLVTLIPNNIWAATLSNSIPTRTNVSSQANGAVAVDPTMKVTRRAPGAERISVLPRFSAQPSEAEIFNAPIFSVALIPVGARPSPEENKALANALAKYVARKDAGDQSILTDFLNDHPNSAWKPALLVNLGIAWRQTGHFSKAMAAWHEAWDLSKNETEIKAKALADRALGEFVQINAWVGRYETLEPVLAEIGDRQLVGGATEMLSGARQGLWIMNNTPEKGFMCGPYALQQIAGVTKAKVDMSKLRDAKSTRNGFSLTRVKQLADESGLRYQMAKRKPGTEIPINSVVHWKLNHYGAIIKEEQDRYLIQDSTFSHLYGQELWVEKSAMEEESSGYFLVPEGPLPSGWESVSIAEGDKVWGKGPTSGQDPNAFTPQDCRTCPTPADANGNGDQYSGYAMARCSAHLMLVSLNIFDTPIWYKPTRGPAINFQVTYNQRDPYSQVAPNYSNLGSKWTFNWFTYISDSGVNGTRTSVQRYASGGGLVTYSSPDSTGTYSSDRDGNVLQYIAASDTYEMTLPDGSKEVFGQPSTANPGARKVFLTKIKDSAGNTVQIFYDPNGRISYINDALGQSTIFYYDHTSDPHKITRIEDPFHRVAYFDYDLKGRLMKITDVIGITSVFSYSNGDFINQLTTPYGVTTFSFTENSSDRSLTITDPNGDQEYILYKTTADVPFSEAEVPDLSSVTTPNPGLSNQNLIYRNTFYFDKKVMKQYGSSDLSKATVYHWLHDDEVGSVLLTSGILESLKRPLESRVWYLYPNQLGSSFSSGISIRKPNIITRVVDDPNNANGYTTQTYEISYNSHGKITQVKDPVGRQTTMDYYANGLDIWKIRQTTGGNIDELLAEFGPYSTPNHPSTYTDAARQTYALDWNAYGQLSSITNPNDEVARLGYSPDGFLTSVERAWSAGTKTTLITPDSYGRIRTITDSEGYVLTYDYDALNRLTRITYPDQTFEKYEYSRLDLVRAWDRTGRPTEFTYDAVGRPLSIKDRLGRITKYSWCGCGGLESITDPLNQVTSWVHDLQGRTTEKDYFDGRRVQYAYEPRSGRLTSITDARGQIKNYAYFADDTLQGITYTLTPGIHPADLIPTPSVNFTYDPNYQRVQTMTDGTGLTTFSYNPVTPQGTLGAGRLSSVDGPLDQDTIYYFYDNLGRIGNQAFGGGFVEAKTYDELGRMVTHTTPMGDFTSAYLNATHRLTSIDVGSSPNGMHASFDYFDNLGDQRLKKITYQNHQTSNPGVSSFEYQYDVLGNIQTWTQKHLDNANFTKTINLENDPEGQLIDAGISVLDGINNPSSDSFFGYDKAGNRITEQSETTQIGVPPGGGANPTSVIKSSYNSLNQLITRGGSGALPVRFKGRLNEPATVTINGQTASTSPDPASGSGGKIFTASVELNPGNQTVQIVARAGNGKTTVKNCSVNPTGEPDKTFLYDANGNCKGTTDGNVSYLWDAEDRLVSISQGNSGKITHFTYDGFSRLVKIEELDSGTVTSTKRLIWDGKKIYQQREGDDLPLNSGGHVTLKTYYPEGMYIQDKTVSNDNISSTVSQSLFYTRDHLGSIRELVDSAGTIRARYDYDLYGKRSANLVTSNPVEADFGFAGYYYHAPSGLYLTLYRAYDPTLGRWINRDPIAENGGLNLYDYVGNNPVFWIDPYGLVRWGQFLRGLGFFAGGMAGALGSMALAVPSGGLSAITAVSSAMGMMYGLGNMVAAFSPDKEAAKEMLNCPNNVGGLLGNAMWSGYGDAPSIPGMAEDTAGLLMSGNPAEAILAGMNILDPVVNSAVLDEDHYLYDF